ncbi:unnamed protein product, partial [Hapterophycus canaliculatus]
AFALKSAPVVLTQRCRFGNGEPLQNARVQQFTIECNRVQDHSLDPSLQLIYPALVTDADGKIRVPVYDTVLRVNGFSWPEGYDVESGETLGWFQANNRLGVLPEMLAWEPYSRPNDFTRTASETKLLKDAKGTKTQRIKSGGNTYVLDSV